MSKESELIALCKAGDEDAWTQLYKQNRSSIYGLCFKMTKDYDKAEDLYQDIMFHVFKKINQFKGNSKISTWIYRLAINMILMDQRHFKHALKTVVETETESGDTEQIVNLIPVYDDKLKSTPERLALMQGIGTLPKGQRQIYLMHEIEGYEHKEIAKIIGRTLGSSKSQLHKAKVKIKDVVCVRELSKQVWVSKQLEQ